MTSVGHAYARYARAPSCSSPTSCAHDGADASPQVRPRQVVLVSDAMVLLPLIASYCLPHQVRPRQVVLVSDAMVAMGLPAGTYHFGGDTVEV